jgi:adhesin/invasin
MLTAGPATSVGVVLTPSRINADGVSTATATATVSDANGNLVPGDNVQFAANPSAGVKIGTVTNNGDGTYSATITSSTTPGPVVITANDTSVTPNVSGQATLTLASTGGVGPATAVVVSLAPSAITANGTSTSVATATVTDANSNLVAGDTIKFTASPAADVMIGPTTNGNGTYTATITSRTATGPVTITATDTSVSPQITGSSNLTLNAPSAANLLTVSVLPTAIPADGGASHSFAQAAVQDIMGTPVANQTIQFDVDGQPVGSTCYTASDGTCHVTLNSTSVVERETITAIDTTADLLSANYVYLWMVQVPASTSPTTTTPVHPAITTAEVEQSLTTVLRPTGSAASVKALRKRGAYVFSYKAPGAGRLTIDWFRVTGKTRKLIATLDAIAHNAGKVSAKLKLTASGRSLLKHSTRINVTADVSFTATGSTVVRRSVKFTLR